MESYVKENKPVIDLIRTCGSHLGLSAAPIATACVTYHRIIRKQLDMKTRDGDIEKYLLGTTCLYLATKLEEEPQKIRDVVNVAYRYLHPDKKALEIGDTYWKLRDSVTTCELMILRYLNFQIAFDSPLKYALMFCKSLEDWAPNLNKFRKSNFPQICWNIINDLCYVPIMISYPPEVVAASVVYIAFQTTSLELVEEQGGKRWFEVFAPGAKESKLQSIGCKILSLYEYIGVD